MQATYRQPFISEFKLSITKALADQLGQTLVSLEVAPLTAINVLKVQARSGIYELFEKSETDSQMSRVYVGKAKSDLRTRLTQHLLKLSGRENLSPNSIFFKTVYVDEDLDAAAPERMLIDRYRRDSSVPWNTNGFGNKDPGRNRDKTLVKGNHFDALHPIDLNYRPADWAMHDKSAPTILSTLDLLKKATPYNIRFQDHPDLATPLTRPLETPVTVAVWLETIIDALPEGWQATALPGYAIVYLETQTYASASRYWYKSGGVVFSHGSNATFDQSE